MRINLNPIFRFFRNLFKDPRKDLLIAIQITERIKNALDSRVAIFITQMIPGHVDDRARAELVMITEKALKLLHLTQETMAEMSTSRDGRTLLFKSIAGQIYSELAQVDLESAIDQTQAYYRSHPISANV